MLSSSCKSAYIIDDFEDGSFGKWVVEGSAFSYTPATEALDSNISGYKGSFFVASKNHGTTVNGYLTSSAFEIKKDYINFLLGGTSSPSAYVELLIEGESIVMSRPVGNDPNVLEWTSWDVSNYKGKKANIRICADFNEQRKGLIMLDHIEMNNRPKSASLDLYSFTINASKKELLILAEEGGAGSMLSVFSGDHNILTISQQIPPARKDYYISVVISGVKKDDAIYGINPGLSDRAHIDFGDLEKLAKHGDVFFNNALSRTDVYTKFKNKNI